MDSVAASRERRGDAASPSTPDHNAASTTEDDATRIWVPIDHVSAPVIGVLILLASLCIGGQQVVDGIVGEGGVVPYDVLLLFLSLAYMAISLDATGLLRYLACHVCQRASFDGRVLYIMLYLFLWLAGVVLGNDPVILSGTAFLVYVTRTAGIVPPSAWIWSQFTAANIASAVLVSSNPTNLVIATGFDIQFLTYTAYMALPSVVSAVVGLAVMLLYFSVTAPSLPASDTEERESDTATIASALSDKTVSSLARTDMSLPRKRLRPSFIPPQIHAPEIQPRTLLIDPFGAVFVCATMLGVIAALIVTSMTHAVPAYQIGLPGAAVTLLRDVVADLQRARRHPPQAPPPRPGAWTWVGRAWTTMTRALPTVFSTLFKLPVSLLPFAFGMFILAQALNHVGFVTIMARGVATICRHGAAATVFFMALLSMVLCNFGGTNIGSTILLTKVMQNDAFAKALPASDARLILKAGMYAVAFGSNVGALGGTFAASLAGLLWRNVLLHHGIKVTPLQFAWWCLFTVVPATAAGVAVLLAEVQYFTL